MGKIKLKGGGGYIRRKNCRIIVPSGSRIAKNMNDWISENKTSRVVSRSITFWWNSYLWITVFLVQVNNAIFHCLFVERWDGSGSGGIRTLCGRTVLIVLNKQTNKQNGLALIIAKIGLHGKMIDTTDVLFAAFDYFSFSIFYFTVYLFSVIQSETKSMCHLHLTYCFSVFSVHVKLCLFVCLFVSGSYVVQN